MHAFQASNYLARQYDQRWVDSPSIVALSNSGRYGAVELPKFDESDDPLEAATFFLTRCAGCDDDLTSNPEAVAGALRISRTLLTHVHALVSKMDANGSL